MSAPALAEVAAVVERIRWERDRIAGGREARILGTVELAAFEARATAVLRSAWLRGTVPLRVGVDFVVTAVYDDGQLWFALERRAATADDLRALVLAMRWGVGELERRRERRYRGPSIRDLLRGPRLVTVPTKADGTTAVR